jgi:hypothetical protein
MEFPKFSITKFLFLGARHLVEIFLFSQSGLDTRMRLVVWRKLKEQMTTSSDEERGQVLLTILPVNYGDRFPILANLLTLGLGIAFIIWAPSTVVEPVLHIHKVFEDQLYAFNYALLTGQWLGFYIVMSLVSFWLFAAIATLSYGRRASLI